MINPPRTRPAAPIRRRPRRLAPAAAASLAALALAACSFPGPQSPAERETLQGCRSEADRVYAAQNRYQISERDTRDTPFSGSGQPTTPSDGLADEYSHQTRVDDCVRHQGASETAPPATTAPAASPAHGVGNTP